MGWYLYFCDATAANVVRVGREWASVANAPIVGISVKNSGSWTYNQQWVSTGPGSNPEFRGTYFLHVQYAASGNNWQLFYSGDGLSWRMLNGAPTGNALVSKSLSFDHIALVCALNGATAWQRFCCDWMRFNWLTLP